MSPAAFTHAFAWRSRAPGPVPRVQELARAVTDSSTRSFADLYRSHAAFVWRILRRLGVPAADVDDAAHEVFMVAFRRLDTLYGADYERSWLFGISRRVAQQSRRHAQRRPEPLGALRSSDDGPERWVERRQAAEIAHTAIEALDERRRIVFVLAELEQMSAPEVARALDIPVNTVYSRLRKARAEVEAALSARTEGGSSGPAQ